MKKLSLIFIVCVSSFLFSCKDDLELSPFDKLEEEAAFKTPSDFTAALRGSYSRLLGFEGTYYGGRMLILPDVISDNLIISQTGRRSLQSFYQLIYDANSTWGELLLYGYSSIDRANRIIKNLDALPEGEFKNSVEGQARAIRALAHFDLVKTFSPAYTAVADPAAAGGVPIITTPDASAKPSRNTLEETFNFIISELKAAKDLVPNNADMISSGFMNQAAVSSLLARVYLYKGDYPNARQEASEAATLIGSADQAIASLTEFPKIWKDNSVGNAGVVFKLLVTEQDQIYPGSEFNQTSSAGVRSEYVPTFDFYALYDDNDIRKTAYFTTSAFSGNVYNHIVKYSSRPGSSANVVDVKVIRGAEVYLTLAEAQYRTGDEAGALASLDAVRSRRYTGFSSPGESGEALLNEILKQRRLELAFEGHRLYDLKRLGLPIIRSGVYGDNADGSGTPAPVNTRNLPGNDYRFTLPIPTAERQANPNFQQSPIY